MIRHTDSTATVTVEVDEVFYSVICEVNKKHDDPAWYVQRHGDWFVSTDYFYDRLEAIDMIFSDLISWEK